MAVCISKQAYIHTPFIATFILTFHRRSFYVSFLMTFIQTLHRSLAHIPFALVYLFLSSSIISRFKHLPLLSSRLDSYIPNEYNL